MPLTATRELSAARTFAPEPLQVRHAREWACKTLAGWGVTDQADQVELLVSEVVTNGIMHGSGPVDVCLSCGSGEMRTEVHDQGAGRPAQQDAAADDLGGRGLRLVEAISSSWGAMDDGSGQPGKTVYALILLPGEQGGAS